MRAIHNRWIYVLWRHPRILLFMLFVLLLLGWRLLQAKQFDCKLDNTPTPFYIVKDVCDNVLQGNKKMQERASEDQRVCPIEAKTYLVRSCTNIWRTFMLDESVYTSEERQVTIAFSMLVNEHVWQFERLLRSVYRPHHIYCVHVDMNSRPEVYQAVRHLASCFRNVLVPQDRVVACPGCSGQLDAELLCMRELLRSEVKWSWFINLNERHYPLKTMWQLTRTLQLLNHTNSIAAMPLTNQPAFLPDVRVTALRLGLQLTAGIPQIVAVRGFVQFATSDPVANQLREALAYQPHSHATFYSTLNFSPHIHVPGAATHHANTTWGFINSLQKTDTAVCSQSLTPSAACLRNSWLVTDLPTLIQPTQKHLFASGMRWENEHYTLDCLEHWLWGQVTSEQNAFTLKGELPHVDAEYYLRYRRQFRK